MNKKVILGILVVVLLGSTLTVFFYIRGMDISRPYPAITVSNAEFGENKPTARIGVVSRYPPHIIARGYQPIMDYLTRATPYRFELVLSSNYEHTLQQLVNGEVSAAFFGSYLYVKSGRKYKLTPILKPLNENFQPFFRSVLVVPVGSSLRSVSDLRGKRLALPSPESFSGNWLINYVLPVEGIKLAELEEVQHFAHHHTVVYQLLKGAYDAGVIRDYLAAQYVRRGLKIIARSEPIPGSPIVISPRSDTSVVSALKSALLAVNASMRDTLLGWDKEFTHGFITANDSDYNFVRDIVSRMKR